MERQQLGRPEIQPEELAIGREIATGAYGVVYEGVCRSLAVAIKKPNKQTLSLAERREFLHEIEIMSTLAHPNVCLFLGACIQPDILIVTELLEKDLNRVLIREQEEVQLWQRLEWARQAATGIAWLHGMHPPLLHLDIKLSNLLLTREKIVKVCDFGLSRFVESSTAVLDNNPGTPLYMSPEVMRGDPVSTASDIYSFGISLWEILTRRQAFAHHQTYREHRANVLAHQRPQIPADCPTSLAALLARCWTPDPKMRPSAATLVSELNTMIVEIAIPFEDGYHFWSSSLQQVSCEWPLFIKKLYPFLGLPLPDPEVRDLAGISNNGYNDGHLACPDDDDDDAIAIASLRALVTGINKITVSAFLFGRLVGCLGPLDVGFIERVRLLMSKEWFHGELSTRMASDLLIAKGLERGFLLRFSNLRPCFVLSRLESGCVYHYLIARLPLGRYKAGEELFPDFASFLASLEAQRELALLRSCGHGSGGYRMPNV